MGKRCSVVSCQSTKGPFFNFPHPSRDKEHCLKWLSACGNPCLLEIPLHKLKYKTLCKKHFPVNSFILKRLNRTAIPTLKLTELQIPLDPRIYNENVDLQETDCQIALATETLMKECDLAIYEPLKENRDGSLVDEQLVHNFPIIQERNSWK